VKRYNSIIPVDFVESPAGEWVKYEDVALRLGELGRVRALLEAERSRVRIKETELERAWTLHTEEESRRFDLETENERLREENGCLRLRASDAERRMEVACKLLSDIAKELSPRQGCAIGEMCKELRNTEPRIEEDDEPPHGPAFWPSDDDSEPF